jgi:hypothetical protein
MTLAALERNLELSVEQPVLRKRIFNIAIEVFQNIVRHSNTDDATFQIGHENGVYSIVSRNRIENSKIPSLKNALERINDLDHSGLTALYKEIIKTTKVSDHGGAGLGLVDMARKSGEKPEWEFVTMNEDVSFFILKIKILETF